MATVTLVLILFILINSIPIPSFSCPPHQKQALLTFKSNFTTFFNVSPSDHFQSWTPNSDCCSWSLVNCSNTTTVTQLYLFDIMPLFDHPTLVPSFDIFTPIFHIRSLKLLDISTNGLVGPIPRDGFGNLTQLVYLDMSDNSFEGNLGSELGGYSFWNLTSLRGLGLSYNNLKGVLSPEVGNLQYLEVLLLDGNSLTGNIPEEIGNLTKLRYFYLACNKFSGGIPDSIGNMKGLEEIDFSNNSFSMKIPSGIGRLPNMTTLRLHNNRLMGPIPSSIQNLSKLQDLHLQDNKLTGEIPTSIFNITTLKSLKLGGNKLIWNNKQKIVPRRSLYYLSMPSCGISGQIPDWISSHKDLIHLDLSGNKLEGLFLYWLAKMDILSIFLFNNKLTGSIPPRLFESERLTALHLSRNNFSGELPENIGNATGMRFLMLSYNGFSGNIPTIFPTSIEVLCLGGNKFSGNLPWNFTKLVNLQHLDLHDNHITGNFQDALPESPFLQVLVLRNNSFEGFIPTTISNLTNLRILDLSGNRLTGSIPQEITNLTRMIETPVHISGSIDKINAHIYNSFGYNRYQFDIEDLVVNWKNYFQGLSSHSLDIYSLLDLSNNRISGEIPASLGNLKSLKVLNISNNIISGNIPVSFGNLKGIESLDLSHNKISGSIPKSLEKLDGLGILDVSNNRLTGKIPMGGHMSTMNELKYFANNSGLCGMQINITCPEDIPPSEEGGEEAEDDEQLSWMFWEGSWIGFPIGFFLSILIMGSSLNFLRLFKIW